MMMPRDNAYTRMMRKRKVQLCVAYEGGWPVCVGTLHEIAEFWGVSYSSAKWYASPSSRMSDRVIVRTDEVVAYA